MQRKLRIQKIEIESTVAGAPIWVHISGQEEQYDSDTGEKIQVIPYNHSAHYSLTEKIFDIFTMYDQVLQKEQVISGLCVSKVMILSSLQVLQEKYGGTIEGEYVCL